MGKSRRNRARPSRKDPLNKPIKPPSDPELAALREKSILPVIRDLQSSEPKARTTAAAAVANLVSDSRCRKLLLREQVVHLVLSGTITDAALESRAAGWDILRLLAEEEEADFCVHLYRQDVLTALDFAAQNATEALSPKAAKLGKAELKVAWSIVESLVSLTSALSEAQDEILEAVVGLQSIVKLLCIVIAQEESPLTIRLDALSCLLTLTEDNRRMAEFIVADDEPKPFSFLLKLQSGAGASRVLACGVLHNIYSALKWFEGSPGNKDLSGASLVQTLSMALKSSPSKVEISDLPENSQWAKEFEVQQLALEILASIGTSLQESMASSHGKDEEWGGIEDGDDAMEQDGGESKDQNMDDSKMDEDEGEGEGEGEDDEDDIADIQADMDMVTGADEGEDAVPADDLSTLNALVQSAFPAIIHIIKLSGQSDQYAPLQAPALSVLNNTAWSVGCFDFSKDENASILKIWEPAGKSIWKNIVAPVLSANTADVELASRITSLAWAVSRTLAGGRLQLQGDEQKKFISLYSAAKSLDRKSRDRVDDVDETAAAEQEAAEDPFQGLGIKCIGVLGQLALEPAAVPLNREVGMFLLTVLLELPETPVANAVEALNQLFEIYGDEQYAYDKEVFWKDNFLDHLEKTIPKMKAAVKKIDKRSSTELRSRADEALLNLPRFIQYKKKNAP